MWLNILRNTGEWPIIEVKKCIHKQSWRDLSFNKKSFHVLELHLPVQTKIDVQYFSTQTHVLKHGPTRQAYTYPLDLPFSQGTLALSKPRRERYLHSIVMYIVSQHHGKYKCRKVRVCTNHNREVSRCILHTKMHEVPITSNHIIC